VQKIFDPVVDRIVGLVAQQVLEVDKKDENVAVQTFETIAIKFRC